MKQEDYVSYEVAKMLKEKGFNTHQDQHYYTENISVNDGSYTIKGQVLTQRFCLREDLKIYAPSLWDAQKWLREKHEKHVSINMDSKKKFTSYIETKKSIFNVPCRCVEGCGTFDTYEQALNEGIKEALKMI